SSPRSTGNLPRFPMPARRLRGSSSSSTRTRTASSSRSPRKRSPRPRRPPPRLRPRTRSRSPPPARARSTRSGSSPSSRSSARGRKKREESLTAEKKKRSAVEKEVQRLLEQREGATHEEKGRKEEVKSFEESNAQLVLENDELKERVEALRYQIEQEAARRGE